MRIKRLFSFSFCLLLIICLLPSGVFAASDPPSQAGERKLEGGQRDFLWPVPGRYNLTSCFLDNRAHYSLDIDGETGDAVVASYAGTVIEIFTDCEHNWSKKSNCCSSWGNFVLLQHTYRLKSGETTTMYSRYAHLTDVTVSVGQSVTAGQKIGTIGSTGRSSGSHLDYEILHGGISPSRLYSLDPYINDLLELPEELYTTFGQCCQEYVAYVKQLYPRCTHEQFNGQGSCTSCGYVYNWKATRDPDDMGYYTVSAQTAAMPAPYQNSGGTTLLAGQKVSVTATVINGLGQTWYEVSLDGGAVSYVPKADLVFQSYFDSQITGSLSTLEEGQVLKQESHRLDGRITSRYPLRKLSGYLDGECYATWSGSGSDRILDLRGTDLNKKLSFSELAPGEHTLVITAADYTGREAIQVICCKFYIEKTPESFTITYVAGEESSAVTLQEGQPLGVLPVPEQEGKRFQGWFTESGDQVTDSTVPSGSVTLYAKWETICYTVTFGDTTRTIAHGESIAQFPQLSREGYRLVGWFTPDGEQVTENTVITGDLVLTPHWEQEALPPATTQSPTTQATEASVPATMKEKTPNQALWVILVAALVLAGIGVTVFLLYRKKKQEKIEI